jgi:hypothetical protein
MQVIKDKIKVNGAEVTTFFGDFVAAHSPTHHCQIADELTDLIGTTGLFGSLRSSKDVKNRQKFPLHGDYPRFLCRRSLRDPPVFCSGRLESETAGYSR